MADEAFARRMQRSDRAGEFGRRIYGAFAGCPQVGAAVYRTQCDLHRTPEENAADPMYTERNGPEWALRIGNAGPIST